MGYSGTQGLLIFTVNLNSNLTKHTILFAKTVTIPLNNGKETLWLQVYILAVKVYCMQRSSSPFPSYGESESHSVVSDSLQLHGLYSPWNSPGQNTGVDSLFFLQGIFPTQGSNPGLPNCRWILYQLNLKASRRILEGVVYPFSRGSSQPRNQTGLSCIAGGFFINWTIMEAPSYGMWEYTLYFLV